MINDTIKIDNTAENTFQVTWDVGRRCNYDCTYCPSVRHDNHSPHASLETLIDTYKFVREYFYTLRKHHRTEQHLAISFTGGEPTNNPNFLKLIEYIHDENDSNVRVSLTTNGTFSSQYADRLIELKVTVTISYHCEADKKIKSNIIKRIYQLDQARRDGRTNKKSKVNLMFHSAPEYFDECVDIANDFIENGIKFTPRIIGEPGGRPPYAHIYTDSQLSILKNFWENREANIKKISLEKKSNKNRLDANSVTVNKIVKPVEKPVEKPTTSKQQNNTKNEIEKLPPKPSVEKLGRMCCGGRTFCKTNRDNVEETSTFVKNTNFKGWKCLVNWHWLHIEQQTDKIFHHQTCQATFHYNKRGHIGKISEHNKLLKQLKDQLATGKMPVITCSRFKCGCGMCLSKAKSTKDINVLFDKTVKDVTPIYNESLYDDPVISIKPKE
jgi:organic radical activating enzyme